MWYRWESPLGPRRGPGLPPHLISRSPAWTSSAGVWGQQMRQSCPTGVLQKMLSPPPPHTPAFTHTHTPGRQGSILEVWPSHVANAFSDLVPKPLLFHSLPAFSLAAPKGFCALKELRVDRGSCRMPHRRPRAPETFEPGPVPSKQGPSPGLVSWQGRAAALGLRRSASRFQAADGQDPNSTYLCQAVCFASCDTHTQPPRSLQSLGDGSAFSLLFCSPSLSEKERR